MKQIDWFKIFAESIDIQVVYSDAAEQGWGYDCSKYLSLDTLKANMAEDFRTLSNSWDAITITVVKDGETIDGYIPVLNKTGEDFVRQVFNKVDGLLNVN